MFVSYSFDVINKNGYRLEFLLEPFLFGVGATL